MPEVGELLSAKYRVLSLLGAGGMGSVYRAENVLTGKHVALKWMHPQYAASPDAGERLIREARAASKLSHPNVVDVYDVIRDDQTLFLVMELLQGESLRDYLRKQTRPPMHELIALLLGAMAGVAAAHAQGVIHRDLKPDNIFLVRVAGMPQPIAKVLDFGIAKLAELTEVRGSTLTQTGTAIGTPVYMSFEQLRGDKNVDLRTDVYAFGVMLYEALVGQPPFTAATLSELAIKVATTDPVPLKTLRPDAPSGLCAIIDRAIKRDRQERWPDVPSLIQQLTPFAQAASFREHMTFQDMTAPCVAEPVKRVSRPLSAPDADWTATAALPNTQPNVVPIATSKASHVPSDSLIARELADLNPRGRTTNNLPVWFAAAALLAVTAIAAVLLLREPQPTQPTSTGRPVEISSPTVIAPPQPGPGLRIEQLVIPSPSPSPSPSADPPTQPDQLSNAESPREALENTEPSSTSRRRRRAAAREQLRTERIERIDTEPDEPRETPRVKPEPVQAKPRNAGDMLGF